MQVNGAALKKGGAMSKSEYDVPAGVTVLGAYKPEFEAILTPEALEFVATLARKFSPRCGTIGSMGGRPGNSTCARVACFWVWGLGFGEEFPGSHWAELNQARERMADWTNPPSSSSQGDGAAGAPPPDPGRV